MSAPYVRQQGCLMDDDSELVEVPRWNFLIEDTGGIAGLPPEAWVEMFTTPLGALGGKRVYDVIREEMGLDPIN